MNVGVSSRSVTNVHTVFIKMIVYIASKFYGGQLVSLPFLDGSMLFGFGILWLAPVGETCSGHARFLNDI